MKIISKEDLEKAIKKIHGGSFTENDCLYSPEKKIFWLKAYGSGVSNEKRMFFLELKNVDNLSFYRDKVIVKNAEKQVFFDWIDVKENIPTLAFFSNGFKVEISVRKIDANFEIFSAVS